MLRKKQCADKDKSCTPSFQMYDGVWVSGGPNSPKRRHFCRGFAVSHQESAFALCGSAALFCYYQGREGWRGQMVSRFYCSLMRAERGKASGLGPGCGTSRTGSHMKWLIRLLYKSNSWDNVQFLSYGEGAYICKGNDQISTFKCVTHQTSKMTSLNTRLPGPGFISK